MPWFKVDDALALHMKAITAGNAALGLWVRAGSWSMHQLTDGFIPRAIVTALGGTKADTVSLVGSGLWHSVDGGFQFHDWSEYQPTRESVLAEREAAAERMRRVRANKQGNVQANERGTNGDRSASPSRPVPTPDSTKPNMSQSGTAASTEPTDTFFASSMTQRLAGQAGLSDLARIADLVRKHTGREIDGGGAYRLALWLIEKSKSEVTKPQRYVEVCIADHVSAFEIQQYIDGKVA